MIWRVFFAGPSVPPSTVILSGRIEGDDSAVAPKTAGRVLEVRVREGDQVKRTTEAYVVHHADFMAYLPFKNPKNLKPRK